MKQEEKTKRTREKIIQAAVREFGGHSYADASLNHICQENHISKGLIYHNFKNKDELYLECVKNCYQELTAYLDEVKYEAVDVRENIQLLLTLRHRFFQDNPNLGMIFFQTVIQPPAHLITQIKAIRRPFDAFHVRRYQELLNQIELRENISAAMALEYFLLFQEMFNTYFQSQAFGGQDFSALIENHENSLQGMLDMMLYGVAKEAK